MNTSIFAHHTVLPDHYRREVVRRAQYLQNLPATQLPLAKSWGRILAEELYARENVPSFPNSQMDGYALTDQGASREQRTFTVGPDIAAGAVIAPQEFQDDLVYPIMTGAALPTGLTTVVPEERCEPLGQQEGSFAAEGSMVRIPVIEAGSYVRLPGEDIAAGELLAHSGERLTPALIGALAAQGISTVAVQPRPRALVLTGGDEIAAEDTPGPSQIRDANGPMLSAFLQEDGAEVHRLKLTDNPAELIEQLENSLDKVQPQLIISSGGISHGKYEVIKNAVSTLHTSSHGLRVTESWFGHVRQQPGGPQGLMALATEQGGDPLLWLALPGNPVSTLVSYRLLVKPLLNSDPRFQQPQLGVLATETPVKGLADKTQFSRAQVHTSPDEQGGNRFSIQIDQQTASHLLHRAAQANALVEIEPNQQYRKGDILRWYPLSHAPTT